MLVGGVERYWGVGVWLGLWNRRGLVGNLFFFFFQAEDGIRDSDM